MANSRKVDNSNSRPLKGYLLMIWRELVDLALGHDLSDADVARIFKVHRATITKYKNKKS